MKTTFRHIPQLDGLRGLAALLVFWFHFGQNYVYATGDASRVAKVLLTLSKSGAYGVDIFFTLSGFLITSLLVKDRGREHYFHNFYWKRVLRLVPVLLLHLAIASQLLRSFWPYALTSLLFIANFDQIFQIDNVGPTWTLAIEEQFYLIWPALVRFCSPRTLYRIAIFGVLFSLCARAVVLAVWGQPYLHLTMYRVDGLFLGALLGMQWMDVPYGDDPWIARFVHMLNHRVTLGLGLVALAYFAVHQKLPGLSQFTLLAFLTYRLIRYVAVDENRLRWLRTPVLTYMGAISYGMYMYHLLLFWTYDKHVAMTQLGDRRAVWTRLVVTAAATLALSSVSRFAMELPVERLRRFVLKPAAAR